MYCPKCAKENPDDGRFCRKCGFDLSGISLGNPANRKQTELASNRSVSGQAGKKNKEVTWEGAMGALFGGIAFLVIAIVLAFQPMGAGWWFWMLIPGFGGFGTGLAMVLRIIYGDGHVLKPANSVPDQIHTDQANALPPKQATLASEYSGPDRHGEKVVVPSVTEETTRRLEMDAGGKTMKLPED